VLGGQVMKESMGVSLYFEAFENAFEYYSQGLGPPAYVEGKNIRGWPIGSGWLTLFRAGSGGPTEAGATFYLNSLQESGRIQHTSIDVGVEGPPPSDELMYELVRFCLVLDPFDTEIVVVSRLPMANSLGTSANI
jgi:hypothetical protein